MEPGSANGARSVKPAAPTIPVSTALGRRVIRSVVPVPPIARALPVRRPTKRAISLSSVCSANVGYIASATLSKVRPKLSDAPKKDTSVFSVVLEMFLHLICSARSQNLSPSIVSGPDRKIVHTLDFI